VAVEFVVLTVQDGHCSLHPHNLDAHIDLGTSTSADAVRQLVAQRWAPYKVEMKDGIEMTILERDLTL
jgi:hypothetical protein